MNERISEKKQRLEEIKDLVLAFCEEHLDDELYGYALELCDMLGRKRRISITRGKKEIWAASIIYVIARLNFLFDPESEFFFSADTVCNFFGTKKSTVGNKASQIERACNLGLGAEGLCSPEISDALTLVELPNGLLIPKNMLPEFDIVYEVASDEEAEEMERLLAEKKQKERSAAKERREQKEGIKRKKKDDKQLSLFDDFNA